MSGEVAVPKLLTTRELSRLTGLQLWRIYALVKAGKGPAFMPVGRTRRFPADGVVKWIEEQTNNHTKGN